MKDVAKFVVCLGVGVIALNVAANLWDAVFED